MGISTETVKSFAKYVCCLFYYYLGDCTLKRKIW